MGDAISNPYENYDLKAEAEEARDPRIRFAFEFPELLERFQKADMQANAAKATSRRVGLASVALVLLALLMASAAPLLKTLTHEVQLALAYSSALLGLAGTALGLAGMTKSSSRRAWLRRRLETETMRLFHFRFMAARLPQIAAAGADAIDRADYVSARQAAFSALIANVLSEPERELQRIAASHDLADFELGVGEAPLTGREDAATLEQALSAWRVLRLDWQLNYCEAKLAHRSSGARMSSRQVEHLFSAIAWVAVAAIILLHVALLSANQLNLSLLWIEVLVTWTALVALAARALEDGLQPQREVERYEQYRANILVARERLDRAQDAATKLEIIRTFERVSLEEMRVFMRTHARSKFLL